jgi:hypothetical protein
VHRAMLCLGGAGRLMLVLVWALPGHVSIIFLHYFKFLLIFVFN